MSSSIPCNNMSNSNRFGLVQASNEELRLISARLVNKQKTSVKPYGLVPTSMLKQTC